MNEPLPALPAPPQMARVKSTLRKLAAKLILWPVLIISACLALPGLLLLAVGAALWLAADTLSNRLME